MSLKSKIERQSVGINNWESNFRIGILDWCTGVGKTFVSLKILNNLFNEDVTYNVIILVPRVSIKEQWIKRLDTHLKRKRCRNNVTVLTSSEALNKAGEGAIECDLLICDEYHEFYSTEYQHLINTTKIRYNWFLGLTANYVDKSNRHDNFKHLHRVVDKISEQEAIENKWITDYIEYNLGISLTEDESILYKDYTAAITKSLSKFGGNFQMMMDCLSGSKGKEKSYTAIQCRIIYAKMKGWKQTVNAYDDEQKDINALWNPQKILFYASSGIQAVLARKALLYNSPEKVKVASILVEKFDSKTICFSQSTVFADELTKAINDRMGEGYCASYHTKVSVSHVNKINPKLKYSVSKIKNQNLDDFIENKIKCISTVSSLDGGIDIEDIKIAIIASGTSGNVQRFQRKNRATRIDKKDKKKVPLILNIYFKDTKDYDWLRSSQKFSKDKIVWVDDIDDIDFEVIDKNQIMA